MRDYQRIKNNKWILPTNLYRQTLYAIRDYDRLKEEYEYIIQGRAIELDGLPRGSQVVDPTAETAIKIEKINDRIKAIEAAKKAIPEEYIKGVWQNILYDAPFPLDAARSTYGLYKSKLVFETAKLLTLI